MGQFDSDGDRSRIRGRPLTEAEASAYLRRRQESADSSAQVQHWVDLAQMVRATGEASGYSEDFSWDGQARVARLYGSQGGHRVLRFLGNPWARLICNAWDRRWWVAAEGRVEFSEPSREQGDAVGRELMTKAAVHWVDREGKYQEAVDRRLMVIRIHVTRLYGAERPEDEWEEYEEPRYW